MKAILLTLMIALFTCQAESQTAPSTSDVIEGGKVIVELIKAISQPKQDKLKDNDCRDQHANLCIINKSQQPVSVTLYHRERNESRELFIQASQKECSLHAPIGVWTYDLRIAGSATPIRKGDILLESCQDLAMHIHF